MSCCVNQEADRAAKAERQAGGEGKKKGSSQHKSADKAKGPSDGEFALPSYSKCLI